MQPEIPSTSTPDLASGAMAQLTAGEGSLMDIQLTLHELLLSTQNPLPLPFWLRHQVQISQPPTQLQKWSSD
jgi:hypothetical protein